MKRIARLLSTNQSIKSNQSIIKHSINQSINQLINQSIRWKLPPSLHNYTVYEADRSSSLLTGIHCKQNYSEMLGEKSVISEKSDREDITDFL